MISSSKVGCISSTLTSHNDMLSYIRCTPRCPSVAFCITRATDTFGLVALQAVIPRPLKRIHLCFFAQLCKFLQGSGGLT